MLMESSSADSTPADNSSLLAAITVTLSVALTVLLVFSVGVAMVIGLKLYRQSITRTFPNVFVSDIPPNFRHSCPEEMEMQLPTREEDTNSCNI
ncbi:hypothetical protein EMCRGX_G010121 [Ephydatia muelleri]|eukprot:Em0003g1427a